MKKIFISSTYQDLQSHRKLIWELLETYEVEVKGMEKFGARTCKALQTCLDEVSDSDIFICIIGMRYGSIDKETNKSFTQLEYELAKKQGKEVFIYLFDEKEGKIAPSLIDFENHQELLKFRKILQENHTVDSFIAESDLVKKIGQKLNQLFVDKTTQIFRPEKLESYVHHFTVKDEKWVAIVGLLYGKPVEIFTGLDDHFWIPEWVQFGWTYKNYPDGVTSRYDFQFSDRQGYKITIEGISRAYKQSISNSSTIMTKLLMNDTKVEVVLDVIREFPFTGISDAREYYNGIKKALSNIPTKPIVTEEIS